MFESKINRGRANGYAPLDGSGKVPLDKLPPIQSTINTGSFATTGSNVFTGSQTISGSGDSSLTIGQLNYYGGPSFDLRVTGSEDSAITLTSNVASLVGAIVDTNNYSDDVSIFANTLNGGPYSDGPTAGILVQKSGSFQSDWLFDYDGKSYFPGDINIGYNSFLTGLTSGSLNIRKGNINVSGSVNISSSLVVASSVVSNGSINALNSDLIIDGGDLIVSGASYFSGSLNLSNGLTIDSTKYGTSGDITIGGDSTYIRIDDGGAPPALILATNGGENEWYFGLDGSLTTPGDIVLSGSFAQQVNYAPMGSGSYEETPEGEVTELDITKDIHLIDITGIEGNSHYYLPNGLYDGQVVRLALKGDDIASPNNVYVWVESLRTDTGAGTQFVDWLPFFADTPRSLATAVWIGGSWNIDNSHFGMW